MVDVLEAMPLERLVLVLRSQDEPLVVQLGRIIEAVDVPTGAQGDTRSLASLC